MKKQFFFFHLETLKLEAWDAFHHSWSREAVSFSGFAITVHLAYFVTLSVFTSYFDESITNQKFHQVFPLDRHLDSLKTRKKVFVVVITWIVNLSHIWLLIVFRDRSFTFVFKTFNLFFEFITMFLGEIFVVNNFFLLKQLCSLIQNFSIEKKIFSTVSLWYNSQFVMQSLISHRWTDCFVVLVFRTVFTLRGDSQNKTLVFSLPSACWQFKNDRCGVKHWSTLFLEKPCSNCHRLPLFITVRTSCTLLVELEVVDEELINCTG